MNILVLDVGRSHIKLCLVDESGKITQRLETENKTATLDQIEVFDTPRIWRWFLVSLTQLCLSIKIDTIVVTTHGAAVALLDENGDLILDVMCYESGQYQSVSREYDQARDDFRQSGSPQLENGLNLGKQLFWLEATRPDIYSKIQTLLTYPQYWSYLLSGVLATEVSSLGTHTDIWFGEKGEFSRLAFQRGWKDLFPPLKEAWQSLGHPGAKLCEQTGLNPDCKILCGVHDSNATMAYHYEADKELTLLSTGTWVIGMSLPTSNTPLDFVLTEERDELLNVNILGSVLPSFRFMGGREWAVLSADAEGKPSFADLDEVLAANVMALPSFSDQGGAYRKQKGRVMGECQTALQKKALASLYCAQIAALSLRRFAVAGKVIIDGPFVKDRIFVQVLAILLDPISVLVSEMTDGTALGAARLAIWPDSFHPTYTNADISKLDPSRVQNLLNYHQKWCGLFDL